MVCSPVVTESLRWPVLPDALKFLGIFLTTVGIDAIDGTDLLEFEVINGRIWAEEIVLNDLELALTNDIGVSVPQLDHFVDVRLECAI